MQGKPKITEKPCEDCGEPVMEGFTLCDKCWNEKFNTPDNPMLPWGG